MHRCKVNYNVALHGAQRCSNISKRSFHRNPSTWQHLLPTNDKKCTTRVCLCGAKGPHKVVAEHICAVHFSAWTDTSMGLSLRYLDVQQKWKFTISCFFVAFCVVFASKLLLFFTFPVYLIKSLAGCEKFSLAWWRTWWFVGRDQPA